MNRKNRAIRCIALLGAALLLTGAIGGCSPKENASSAAPAGSGNTSEEDTSNRPYTEKAIDLGGRDFTILMLGGSGSVFPNPDSDSYENDLERIRYVEEKYGCKLKFDTTYGYPEIHEYIVTNAVAGLDVADIMYSLPWQTVEPYITQNIAVPLNPYLDFDSPMLADMTLNKWGSFLGNQYIFCVSKNGVNCGLLYNKDIFARENLEDPFELQQNRGMDLGQVPGDCTEGHQNRRQRQCDPVGCGNHLGRGLPYAAAGLQRCRAAGPWWTTSLRLISRMKRLWRSLISSVRSWWRKNAAY